MRIPWWWLPLVGIDVETTGFGRDDRIVQIAVVSIDRGVETGSRVWLVDPGIPIRNAHVHGITDAMVTNAPRFHELASEIAPYLRGAVPVAYSAAFDARFIQREWSGPTDQCPALDPDATWIDPLPWVRYRDRRLGRQRSGSLSAVAKRYGVELPQAHDALHDARAALGLLSVVKAEAPTDLAELLRVQNKLKNSGVGIVLGTP